MIRIGTRASKLALVQARHIATLLGQRMQQVEIIEINTSGDRGEAFSDKARWTSELELALLEGRIDVAVHSCKDVPGELADGTVLAAITEREDPADVLCGAASLAALAPGARVGTASLRRAAQLLAVRPDVEIVELRGNVDTRLGKLAAGDADAIVLAAAGLRRLGRFGEAGGELPELLPAAGQGALALQTGMADSSLVETVGALAHGDSEMCVRSERELTLALGASCHTAVGAYAAPAAESGQVRLRGWVGLPDGSEWIADELTGHWGEVGGELATRMIAAGARDLLARAEEHRP